MSGVSKPDLTRLNHTQWLGKLFTFLACQRQNNQHDSIYTLRNKFFVGYENTYKSDLLAIIIHNELQMSNYVVFFQKYHKSFMKLNFSSINSVFHLINVFV